MRKIIICFLLLTSCEAPKTLLPDQAVQAQASFDGQDHDSGVKGYIDGQGFVLSPSTESRYKSLCEKFGKTPIGLSKFEDKIILNKEGMVLFLELNRQNLNQ